MPANHSFALITSQMGRALATDPLFFAVVFGVVGVLMVTWTLTDAGARLRAWSPQYYAFVFGSGSGSANLGGLARGTFLILLGLFFLYRFFKASGAH